MLSGSFVKTAGVSEGASHALHSTNPFSSISMPNNSVRNDLREWAQRAPDRPALVCGDLQLSYGFLDAEANRLAHVFKSRGLARGEHVAALLANGTLSFIMAWAAYRSGLYFTPIPNTLSAPEAAYIVSNSEARIVIVDQRYHAVGSALPGLVDGGIGWLSAGGDIPGYTSLESLMATAASTPRPDETPGNLMFYTSGTTGRPKGVIRPLLPPDHAGPPPFASDLLALFAIDSDTRYLSTAPLYHAAPLRFSLAVTAAGGTVHVMEKFDAAEALRNLQKWDITHSQWVPTMFQRMLQLPDQQRASFAAPHHKLALHSAAPCPVQVKRAMIEWWGPILHEYYSGSEGVGLTSLESEEWLRKPGSVGKARKGTIHVLGDDDAELPSPQIGRIYFSGVGPFAYFNDPEKTAARTTALGYQTFGDVGYVDAEGYLFLTDRLDDMIISGGVNVYPQEIESVLLEVPEVADAAVVGRPHPDFGECAVAFIVARAEFAADSAGVLASARAYCSERLGRVKRPAEFHIVESLPRSATGKLLRRMLRET